jgi:outer membrane murein-binding lipoprotein Lpp
MKKNRLVLVLSFCVLALATSCSNDETSKLQAKVNELQAQIDAYKAERETTAKNLKTLVMSQVL